MRLISSLNLVMSEYDCVFYRLVDEVMCETFGYDTATVVACDILYAVYDARNPHLIETAIDVWTDYDALDLVSEINDIN